MDMGDIIVKDCCVNINMTLGDKFMLLQASIKLECHTITELITEIIRRECGYTILDEYGNIVDISGEIPDLEIPYPDDPGYSQKTIQSIRFSREEFDMIQAYASKHIFAGVPSFILHVLRRKGFISPRGGGIDAPGQSITDQIKT